MYTKIPTDNETVVEVKSADVETTFQLETVRRFGFKEPNTKWTVCCDTKENTKVPKLEKYFGREAVSK